MKRLLQYILHPLHFIKWWHLVIVILIFAPLSLYALRHNSLQMGELKTAVVEADKAGEGIKPALQDLQRYVFSHMNTSTRVELAESYARDVAKAQKQAAVEGGAQDLYARAEAECNRPGVPGVTRAACVQEYITERAQSGSNPQPVELPDDAIYKFEFAAPRWSFDVAGVSILVVFMSLFTVAGKFLHKAIQ